MVTQAVGYGRRHGWRHGRRHRWRWHGQHRLRICQRGADAQSAAVATALDGGPVSNPLIIAVLNQTVAGARQAFDALSGEVFGSVHNAQGQEAQFARSAMLGRMRQGSMRAFPVILARLALAGRNLPTRSADMPDALTQSRPRPAHEAPRAI